MGLLGSCLVSLHFLCDILSSHSVLRKRCLLLVSLRHSNFKSRVPGSDYDYETYIAALSSPSSSRGMSASGDGLGDDEDYEGSGGDDEGSGSAGSGSGAGEDHLQTKKEAVIPDLEPCRGYLFKASIYKCLKQSY